MTTVESIMARNLLTVTPETSLTEAARQMEARGVGAVLVMAGAQLAGILTERDILRAVAKGDIATATVDAWMTRDPETVEPSETTAQAATLMIHGGFRHLPVLDAGEPVGIVSIRDLMRFVVDDTSPRGA
jgi:CBS domain-containing protein